MPKILEWLTRVFFPKQDLSKTWITFGNSVYGPGIPPPEVWAHEQVHIAQQKNWLLAIPFYALYLTSKRFRYMVELPGYRAQLRWYYNNKPLHQHHQYLVAVAKVMSGPQYNFMVDYWRAFYDLSKPYEII